MIGSFKDERTEDIYKGLAHRSLSAEILKVAKRKLQMIASAHELQDLRSPPANRLEALKGDRNGQYSIRINKRWRICFVWKDHTAYDIEIVDYH